MTPTLQPAPGFKPIAGEAPETLHPAGETSQQPLDRPKFGIKFASDEWQTAIKSGHVDTVQFVCQLCERMLGSAEKLEKHVRESKLHVENFEEERRRVVASMRYDYVPSP